MLVQKRVKPAAERVELGPESWLTAVVVVAAHVLRVRSMHYPPLRLSGIPPSFSTYRLGRRRR